MKPFLSMVIVGVILNVSLAVAGDITGKVTLMHSDDGQWVPSTDHSNAIVYVIGFSEPPDDKTIYLDQVDKTFDPLVLPVTKGHNVLFRNKDEVNHNIFSLSKTKRFDLGLFKAPEEKSVTFDRPGLVNVFCNIHHQMRAKILVLKNNKYAVTDASGRYQINGVPDGKLKVRVWVEGAKVASKRVTVTSKSRHTLDFTMRVRQRVAKHLNKFGKPYKEY